MEGDLVHEKPDCAKFPMSAPDTNISSFYSGSVLLLGSGIRNILLEVSRFSTICPSSTSHSFFIPVGLLECWIDDCRQDTYLNLTV